MSDRAEHLAWCKARALALLDDGNLHDAFASMISDMGKHPGTSGQINGATMLLGTMAANDADALRRWIEGF